MRDPARFGCGIEPYQIEVAGPNLVLQTHHARVVGPFGVFHVFFQDLNLGNVKLQSLLSVKLVAKSRECPHDLCAVVHKAHETTIELVVRHVGRQQVTALLVREIQKGL